MRVEAVYVRLDDGKWLREKVNDISGCEIDPKADAFGSISNHVQCSVLFRIGACKSSEFSTEQCSMQPLILDKKAFCKVGSISLLERRID